VAVGVRGKLKPGSLVGRIADALRKREGCSVGLRDCDAGFAASLGSLLLEVAEGNADLAACLEVTSSREPLCCYGTSSAVV
jgi:hypothetical protein